MDDRAAVDDLVELLSLRRDLLAALDGRSADKARLVAELGVSRSTVDRGLRRAESEGLVAYHDGAYTLTAAGRVALEQYDSFREDLGTVAAARSVLEPLAPDAPLAPAMLSGADIVPAEEPAPTRPAMLLRERIAESNRWRGLGVAETLPSFATRFHEAVLESGLVVDLVMERSFLDYLEETYPDTIPEMQAAPNCSIHTAPTLPYGLGIFDANGTEEACVVVYDENKTMSGLVRNDSEAAVDWAESVFERYREQGTLV